MTRYFRKNVWYCLCRKTEHFRRTEQQVVSGELLRSRDDSGRSNGFYCVRVCVCVRTDWRHRRCERTASRIERLLTAKRVSIHHRRRAPTVVCAGCTCRRRIPVAAVAVWWWSEHAPCYAYTRHVWSATAVPAHVSSFRPPPPPPLEVLYDNTNRIYAVPGTSAMTFI